VPKLAFAQRGQVVFVRAIDLQTLQRIADRIVERFGAAIEGSGGEKTEGKGEGDGHEPFRPDPTLRHSQSHDDETELAVRRERCRGHPGRVRPQPEPGQQAEESDTLEREENEDEQ
jgi:hypothetical protein